MNYSSPFTSKIARVGIASTLALLLATSPLGNMNYTAAQAAPTSGTVESAVHNTQKDTLEQTPIQYEIQARLNEKDMTLQGNERIT
ncbi:hypothetical protein [Paenibacillus sp. Z3-2]